MSNVSNMGRPGSEEDNDNYRHLDLYHTSLKIDDFGNLYQVERRLDSESFNSDSTLLVDENKKIQKLVEKSVPVNDTVKFRNPTIQTSLFNEIQPKREYTVRDSEGNFLRNMKRCQEILESRLETGDKSGSGEQVDSEVYDWRNWEYVEGLKGRDYTHTAWEENFFFRVKVASQEVPVKGQEPGTRHIPGLKSLVDTRGYIGRKIAGYFRMNYPTDEEKEEREGIRTTKFKVLKSKKYSVCADKDPEEKIRKELRSVTSELEDVATKHVSEIVRLYSEFCGRRRPLSESLDIFQLCRALRLDLQLDRVKNALVTYWTLLGYIQLLLKYQGSTRSEELFFKQRGENFMKILCHAGDYSYDQLMNDPVNGDFYRAIRNEPINEIPIFLEQVYQEVYPTYYAKHWLLRHEDERQLRALPRFTDRNHERFSKDIEHIETVYPECIMRYQVKNLEQEKEKNIPLHWGTRSRPGFKRIKSWVKKMSKKRVKKPKQRIFKNLEDLIAFTKNENECEHIKGNFYYHKNAGAEDFEAEDVCKDYHSDDCLSFRDDWDKPRVFPPDMFLDAAQYAFYKTFCDREGAKGKETLSDPAIAFRLYMSKYLYSDRDRLAAEKKFYKPSVWRTKFSAAMEPYLAALKDKNPESSVGKRDYISRYRGILDPEDIVRLEEENKPSTELRNTNLQDCIKGWIEKPSYVFVKTGYSLIDTPEDSEVDNTDPLPPKKLKTLQDRRQSDFRHTLEEGLIKEPNKYENYVRNRDYLEKLDVSLEKHEIVIMCFSEELHYVGKLRSEDIKFLIESADKFRKGKLDESNWNVKRVAMELVPVIIEIIKLKQKKEVDPKSNPVEKINKFSLKKMKRMIENTNPLRLAEGKNKESRMVGNECSGVEEVVKQQIVQQPAQNISMSSHPCTASKEFGLKMKASKYQLQGKCFLPELIENKINFYILKLFVDELDQLVFRKLIPCRLPNLLRYFNTMVKNRMKKRNEYKHLCGKKEGGSILDIIPRTFDMDHVCESIPQEFSYSHLTDYKFTEVNKIPIDKVIRVNNLRRKILNKFKLSHKTAKKCIENSIRNSIKLAKRKALLRIISTSIEKTRNIEKCIEKKRKLKSKLLKIEKDLQTEKKKRKSIYLSFPSPNSKERNPCLVEINNIVNNMKKKLEEFRKTNLYTYLYYMATDLFKGLTSNDKKYINPGKNGSYPSFFFGSRPQGKGGIELPLDIKAVRNEFEARKEKVQHFANRICGLSRNKRNWHFKAVPKTVPITIKEPPRQKNVTKYNKKFKVLVSENTKRVFALPRLYKFIEWTKSADLNQRYFTKAYDVAKRKGAYVIQVGNIILKGSEKVIKKCLLCLRMFGIKKSDLGFALILYAKLQFQDSKNVLFDELSELREEFSKQSEKNDVINQLIQLEDRLKKENDKIPEFITWHAHDKDYHLKTFIGGEKSHKSNYESFFDGLKCKKNKILNKDIKFHDLHEYQYYNYHTDYNYSKKNDYSSDEGDENENHYLDNLCSCGVEKEVSHNANVARTSTAQKEIQIEYEMDEPAVEEANADCPVMKSNDCPPSVKRIKITSFGNKIEKSKTKKKDRPIDTVQTLSPDTMLQINQFYDRAHENVSKDHIHQFINFMKDIGDGDPPELRFSPPLIDTNTKPYVPPLDSKEIFQKGNKTVNKNYEKKDHHNLEHSKKIADKYMYTEYVNTIVDQKEDTPFISKTSIKPLPLEQIFNYCQKL